MRSLFLLVVVSAVVTLGWGHTGPHVLSLIRPENSRIQWLDTASITASPTTISNGDYVTVSYSNANPSKDDWIGMYSPTTVNIKETTPVKYQMADKSPNYLTTGKGSLRFRLINMRGNFIPVFFSGGVKNPVAIAQGPAIGFINPYQPLRPRVSLGDSEDSMVVTWSSPSTQTPAVVYSTLSSLPVGSTITVKGTVLRYNASNMCGGPATTTGYRDPGAINQVTLTSLTPGTRYYYKFGDIAIGEMSAKEYSFVLPKVGSSEPINIIAFGDMGQSSRDDSKQASTEAPSVNTTAHMLSDLQAGRADIVYHIGDISYARGYAALWDQFFDQITPVASSTPYQTVYGNHERDFPNSGSLWNGTDSGGECGVPMFTQLYSPCSRVPATSPTCTRRPWYSINNGPVHAVFMSTEHDFSPSSSQYQFLVQDLAAVDRTRTPWVIFNGHRPMYIDSTNWSPNGGDQTVAELLRKYLEPTLSKFQVDLALFGHHHSYQRFCAQTSDGCQEYAGSSKTFKGPWKGTVYMVIGMAGMGLSTNIDKATPKNVEFVDDKHYGYTRIQIKGSQLHMEYVNDADGSILDEFWIDRSQQ